MKSQIIRFRFSLTLLAALVALSQAAESKTLNYTVDLRHTASHIVHVSLKPVGFTAKTGTFQMPVWAPGAYSVTHYGRFVANFHAISAKNGETLPVTKVNQDRWSIEHANELATIEYDVLDSHDDTTSLYFAMANMEPNLFFANATALFGYFDDDKKASAVVKYDLPRDWKLVSSLPSSSPKKITSAMIERSFKKNKPLDETPPMSLDGQITTFYAKNYDELADAPVMASPDMVVRTFGQGSALYDVAVNSDEAFSKEKMDSLCDNLFQIVRAETKFFRETPFEHYTFFIQAPTPSHVTTYAQGALEHANSSDYLLTNFNWSLFKKSFLSIFSHEFFHLWNVKRIHSSLLGPFDYTKRVKTTSLWLSEGVTEYYARTLLSRYRITPPSEFFEAVHEWQHALKYAPPEAQSKSLEELSIDESDFKLDEAELFYTRGPLVAMMLDVEIRNRTNNKKSLDDVMFALNKDAQRGKTFKDEELFPKIEKIVGLDLTDFYNKYIHGTDSLPIGRYLALMGVKGGGNNASSSQLALTPGGNLMFAVIDSTSKLAKAGLVAGDVLYAINNKPISLDNIDLFIAMRDSMKQALVTIGRGRDTLDIPIDLTEKQDPNTKREHGVDLDPNAPPLAEAIRRGVVGQ
jgi:predicted metalloprotease with PDZ domain